MLVVAAALTVGLLAPAGIALAACGDAVVEGDEECDPGGALFLDGDPDQASCTSGSNCYFQSTCCKFNCQYVGTPGAVCDDGNDCTGTLADPDECNMVGTCVPGGIAPSGATCGSPASSACDLPDTCDGGGGCDANHVAGGTPCGDGSTTECTAPDTCDGAGACAANDDPAGTSAPTLCNDGEGCTADECDGSGGCTNPAIPDGGVCRTAAGPCDMAETCTAGACPADGFVGAGIECRAADGDCDVSESCTGAAADCPADGFVTAGTECRATAGECDVAEECTGSAVDCPTDEFVTAGTECRAAAGACDLAEACPGDAAACPADAKSTAECRPADDPCDLAESCDGVADECPADLAAAEGAPCDDQNPCTTAPTCDGSGICTGEPIVCGACEACDGVGGCVPGPLGVCRDISGSKARLIVKDRPTDRDVIVWKFNKLASDPGAGATLDDFGDPTAVDPDDDAYFCLFEEGGTDPLARIDLAAGATCGSRPCWKPLGTVGYKYRFTTPAPKSLLLVKLRASGLGSINLKARGASVPATTDLPFSPPLIAHFQTRNACWQARYENPRRSDDLVFKALSSE